MGKPDSIKVDVVIGADGANSRVAKEIDAGMYPLALFCENPTAATLSSQSCAAAEPAIPSSAVNIVLWAMSYPSAWNQVQPCAEHGASHIEAVQFCVAA